MANNPLLPKQHGALIDKDGRSTVPFRNWLNSADQAMQAVIATATETAATVATLPTEATPATVIFPSPTVNVYGSPEAGYTLAIAPGAIPSAAPPYFDLDDDDQGDPWPIMAASSVSSGSTPTGTGFTHITAGVQDAAAQIGITAGSTSTGWFVNYNGITPAAGQFDGSTTAPTNTTRLNYDGYFYAKKFYGDGSGLTGLTVAGIDLNSAPNILQVLIGRSSWALNLPFPGSTQSSQLGYDGPSTGASVGTIAGVAIAATNAFTRQARRRVTSAAGAGSSAQFYSNLAVSCLDGGFQYTARFGFNDAATVANARSFIGMSATTSALSNANPSAFVNMFGFGNDSGDANLQFIHNDGSGTASKVDLGASFPANTAGADYYEGQIVCVAGSGLVQYSLKNISTGAIVTDSVGISADLPSGSTLLTWHQWRNNGSTALAVRIELGGWSWQMNRDGQ